MLPKAIQYLSEEEYLEGEIFAMSGASGKHNLIVANVIFSLLGQLKKRPCNVYPSDLRLKIDEIYDKAL